MKTLLLVAFLVFVGCTTNPHTPNNDLQLSPGLKYILLADQDIMSQNQEYKQTMYATIQEILGDHVTFVTDENRADVLIYLWLQTERYHDEAMDAPCWSAKVGTRGVRKQTAELYWSFELGVGNRVGDYLITPECVLLGDERIPHQKSVQNTAKGIALSILKKLPR